MIRLGMLGLLFSTGQARPLFGLRAAYPCAQPSPDELQRACDALDRCHGHGVCRDLATLTGPTELPCSPNVTAVCLCQPDWQGQMCDEPACPHNCQGHGVCHREAGRAWCSCDAGYGGVDCSERICPEHCNGRGKCDANYACSCNAGWGGAACELALCTPLADCSAHGLCLNGTCHCAPGWQGDGCEQRTCERDCSGNGVCDEDGRCTCDAGFGGSDCSELACPSACSGHGRCLGYGSRARACKCDDGWGGPDCASRTCPEGGCGAHGACFNGVCYCADGFDGPACSVSHCPSGCSVSTEHCTLLCPTAC
jgi:hypothetical protein